MDRLKQQGVIDFIIPTYMKGITLNSTVTVVDEAEDMTEKQLRLIGSRIGEGARVFFCGDIKQSLLDNTIDNPLVKMCNYFKGNKLFGCIWFNEDVRSETSKLFANMYFD